ncbi:MAG: nitrite reductase large subunit NirB, partial [Tateyamaria sp.]
MTQEIIVIGAGMASGRALEHLFDAGADVNVTLFNAEPRGNYNRIMLSPVLAGDKTYEEIVTHDADWYETNGVTCRFGERVASVDRVAKTVTAENGDVLPYDKLIFGTGSNPFMIPLPGHDLDGVIAYRDLEDTELMMSMGSQNKVVVIGGGLLGLEAAAGMAARGVDVTVVHIMGHLMERQLDEAAGYLLRKALVDKGITVLCQANSKEVLGQDGKVKALLLDDGTELPCDLLVMAVGIRPNVALAQEAGLAVGRGIHVDDQMVTSDENILAVGECVEHNGAIFGLVAPLYDQAKVAAQKILGEEAAFVQKELSTKLKVTGCDLFSAGDFADGEGREDIVFRDPGRGVYRRLVIEDNVVVGTVMYGDTADSGWFFGLIRDKTDIADMRDTVIFGPAYQGGTPVDPLAAVAALPRDAEICGCNGICKGTIVDAIDGGATDLNAVRAVTKASGSCGTCTGLVEQVLAVTMGDDFVMPTAQPMCGCTDMTHEDVRRMIKSQELKSMAAVWQECAWTTVDGCHVCRPALNYYLIADWPLEYLDDPQSRFINERKHANIQKDGTFSVVPRMWGGITTPDELRAIADAADK